MAKTGGTSIGSRGGGTATLSRGGGFGGGAERSFGAGASSAFSSRGLASFGRTEAARPSLTFGKSSEGPKLSFSGSQFQGESRGNKTASFMESRGRATSVEQALGSRSTTNTSSERSSQPTFNVGSATGEIKMSKIPVLQGPESISPMSAPSVPRPSLVPQSESRPVIAMGRTPFSAEAKVGNKTGTFAESTRPAVRQSLPVENTVPTKIELKKVIPQSTTFTRVDRLPSFVPKPVEAVANPIVPMVVPRQISIEITKPQSKVESTIKPIQFEVSAPAPVQYGETVKVSTQGLAELAQLHIHRDDDDETKKAKANVAAAQRESAALSLVRAGLALNFKEASIRVDRSLQQSPDVLANGLISEHVTLKTIDRLSKQMVPEVKAQALKISEAKAEQKTQMVAQVQAEAVDEVQALAVNSVATETKTKNAVKTETKTRVEKNAALKMKDKLKEKMAKQDDKKKKESGIKVDDYALNNRIKQWSQAIRNVLPAWNLEAKVKLSEIAATIRPDKETDSGLIDQLGKNNDGTNNSKHDWRTPLLTSDAEVTASQAQLTGLGEILADYRLPGVIKEKGAKLNDTALKTILSDDTKDDYDKAA